MKTEKEFDLSNYLEQSNATYLDNYKIKVKYVKEFIKKLKKRIESKWGQLNGFEELKEIIDKLAGENLK